ncbi:helix-turn-helix domain-containing GNAT family N-acetyltransferase [Streptomyces sp. V1I6]|uniref:bifunctional helix-turn-helix transcriptional regulator/GNAT family N-acetyltransferase n=1 Tax=Streptomyces sp. V1I6 TaxID=3042273 RepID=UPI0027886842|nr:helix-turn-helix domain-containing GNAT family N-acetyltransferase [Streptomyces sp. V1I6]MDQ0842893.1 DNA-binding MarR family transcriptional regulator/predicted N-acetyltransferase YhbS [Streptomyces sp. V1I6]
MPIQEIRAFNRFYTNLIGALDYGKHLYTPYTLTESRVLYELAHSPRTDAADLRGELSIDAGYLSRLLAKFERDGLVARAPSERDPRRQRITLTDRGRKAAALLDERSRQAVGALVADVPERDRDRLAEALGTVRELLSQARPGSAAEPVLRDPGPGDLGWIVQRHGALYAAEYGWDAGFEGLVARIVADFVQEHDPRLERVWIAETDGRPVGSVMCVRDDAPDTARLRLLLVEPEARGHGLGDRLVRTAVDFARDAGYRDMVLWTNDVLTAARRIYQRAGFTLVAEKPHRSYGADLVGQDWRLSLQEGTDR